MNQSYRLFFHPGEVVEIRGLGASGKNRVWSGHASGPGTVSGYFDNEDAFAKAAEALDAAELRGIYFTLNPVNPALIARAANRLKASPKSTTQDPDAVCIRWLPVDLDPKRPSDISATDQEVAQAEATAKQLAAWLEGEMGFARAIRGFSGNGFHLVYRLPDLPNDEETHKLIVAAVAVLAARYTSAAVDVDVKVGNPARIWKLYGTVGRKGDHTAERPHRRSYLFAGQPQTLNDVPITGIEQLKKLAALVASTTASPPGAPGKGPAAASAIPPGAPPAGGSARPMSRKELGPIDMERYLGHHGIAYNVKADGNKTLYRLDRCLFDPNHGKNEASIVVPQQGAILYQCFHASCKDKRWKDARRQISGDKPIAEFCAGYDPEWKPPAQVGTGMLKGLAAPADPAAGVVVTAGSAPDLPTPEAMDPKEFYEKRGKRPVFVPWYLTQYLAKYLHPIVHTAGQFYRYQAGVWQEFPSTVIAHISAMALKDQVQAGWIDGAIKILGAVVNREEKEWPSHPMLLNVQNGMLDVAAGALVPHDPRYGSRTQLPVRFDPEAFSERWHRFVAQVFADDPTRGKYSVLQQYFGYCLLSDCRFQKALFLYGTGANGKSTVMDVLQAMVGVGNTSTLSLTDLTQRFKSQFMQHKLVNVSTETNTRDPLVMDVFKAVVSGDPITAEQKYGQPYQFRPFAKFVIAMNDAPVVPDKSYGLSRRMLVLNFNWRIPDDQQNPDMAKLLIQEIDGIFTWSVEGLATLLRHNGFRVPDRVVEDTDHLLETMNPLLIFVKECCEVYPAAACSTLEMWRAYAQWCADGKNRPLGRNKFYDQLRMLFPGVTSKLVKISKAGEPEKHERQFVGFKLDAQGRELAERAERIRKREERLFE